MGLLWDREKLIPITTNKQIFASTYSRHERVIWNLTVWINVIF
jgi:hypothetical protein